MNDATNESRVLIKNNIMIKSKYNISVIENRIFQVILYKLKKKNDDTLSCKIYHSEFKEFIKNPNQFSIKAICDALIKLRKSSIFFEDNDRWIEFGFINGHEYDKKENMFKIQTSEKVYSLLRQYLNTGYTPINLQIFLGLTNHYAQRFYELLRLWSGVKTKINYTIDELKEYLMLDGNYPEYGNFKRRVIVPAIKELNKTGFFELDFKEVKQGRKVVSIDFLVKDLDKRIYFKDLHEIKDEDEILESKINPKEIVQNEKIVDNKIENILHIENKAVIKMINNKFSHYDFELNKETIWECEIITLEKDNNIYDSINANNYKYFINTLANKINMENETKDTFNDFPQREYDFEDLESQLLGIKKVYK